jgi:hypothetical protein
MSLKAKLKIVLQANDTVVAESEDASLWQKVLIAINGGSADFQSDGARHKQNGLSPDQHSGGEAIERFANLLGLSRDVVEGACGPSLEDPFLHLDPHCWEAMKKQTPERGPTAYSSIAIAATLLALWFRASGQGSPTQAQAQGVLSVLGIRDQNPARGIERTDWLQSRPNGVVMINPARVSRATAIAKAFCAQKWDTTAE